MEIFTQIIRHTQRDKPKPRWQLFKSIACHVMPTRQEDINFISPIGSQHKKTKAKAQQQQTKAINQSIYLSVTTRQVSARFSMRKIDIDSP